jgi:hypothetical protein
MNWEMISAIAKMVGAIGVIISLVYLAIQIRDQKKHSRNAVINSLTTQFNDFMLPQIENANLCALWVRGLRSFDELDPASRTILTQVGRLHVEKFLRALNRIIKWTPITRYWA